MDKKERQEIDRKIPKCPCGNNLSLERQQKGINVCPSCEDNLDNKIEKLKKRIRDCDNLGMQRMRRIEELFNENKELKQHKQNLHEALLAKDKIQKKQKDEIIIWEDIANRLKKEKELLEIHLEHFKKLCKEAGNIIEEKDKEIESQKNIAKQKIREWQDEVEKVIKLENEIEELKKNILVDGVGDLATKLKIKKEITNKITDLINKDISSELNVELASILVYLEEL